MTEELKPAHEVMVEEIKTHCKNAETMKAEDQFLWGEENVLVAQFCSAFEKMIIPEVSLFNVIEELKKLSKYHAAIGCTVRNFQKRHAEIFKEVNSWIDCHVVMYQTIVMSVSGTFNFNGKIVPMVTYSRKNGGFTKQLHDPEHGDLRATNIESKYLPYPIRQLLTTAEELSSEEIRQLFPPEKEIYFHDIRTRS